MANYPERTSTLVMMLSRGMPQMALPYLKSFIFGYCIGGEFLQVRTYQRPTLYSSTADGYWSEIQLHTLKSHNLGSLRYPYLDVGKEERHQICTIYALNIEHNASLSS